MPSSLADAEVLAQETFIHAYQHLYGFRAEVHLSSWLYRIAVNHCLNWPKRRQRLARAERPFERGFRIIGFCSENRWRLSPTGVLPGSVPAGPFPGPLPHRFPCSSTGKHALIIA